MAHQRAASACAGVSLTVSAKLSAHAASRTLGMSEKSITARIAYLGMFLALVSFGPASARGASTQEHRDPSAGMPQVVTHLNGSAGGTVVPISVENGQVIVNVTINGQGPFPMMFDTGGAEVVTPETATALGLEVEGSGTATGSGESTVNVALTHIRDMRLGGAELSDLPLPVVPLPRFLTDRGSRPPLAGFVGYELLARFAVRLDYGSRRLTLAPAHDFRYEGTGVRVPLSFVGKIPVLPATADGIAGCFEIDTGAAGALVLQRAFVNQHGLEGRHPEGLRMKMGGVDGVFETIATRLDRFTIGDAEIDRPVAEFPSNGKSGLPVPDVDGSMGYQVLRQFVITFDYSHRALWFERSAAFGTKTIQWKTGFQAIKAELSGFRVVTVQSGTPAATAGIRVGDIITEIDGKPAASVGQAEFGELMRRLDGTIVHLGIVRDGARRTIALTLRELLP